MLILSETLSRPVSSMKTPVLTGSEQIERMLVARDRIEKEVEESVAAFRKKAENESWMKTGQAMLQLGANEYTGGAIEKAWLKEKRSGFPHRASIDAVMSGSAMGGTLIGGSNLTGGSTLMGGSTPMGVTVRDGFGVDNGGAEEHGDFIKVEEVS